MAIYLQSAQELSKLLKDQPDKLILLDFYAEWCGPCMQLSPKLDALAASNGNLLIVKADADNDNLETLCSHYKVSALPTLIFFKNGEIVDFFSSADELRINNTIQKFT